MKKHSPTIITEFAHQLSDDDLVFLAARLAENLQDDLAEIFDFVSKGNSKNIALDNLLSGAANSRELFSYVDEMQQLLRKETDRRNLSLVCGKP